MKPGGVAALGRTVFGALRWRAAASVLLMVAVALGEGAAILLLVPLLRLVGVEAGGAAAGAVDRFLGRGFAAAGVEPTLGHVLGAYVLVVAAVATLSYAESGARARVQHEYVFRLRERVYAAVAHARWAFLARARTAELTQSLVAEAERAGRAVSLLAYLASQLLVGAVYLALALRLSAPASVAALAAGAGITLLARRSTGAARRAGEEATRRDADLLEAASAQMDTLKVVKSYGAEDRYLRAFVHAARRAEENRVLTELAYAQARWIGAVGAVVLLGTLLYLAVAWLRLPTATVFLLLVLFSRLVPRVNGAQQSWQYLAHELPAVASLGALVERCERERQPGGAAGGRVALRHGVRLAEVRFAYDGGPEVLAGVELEIPAGEITALVGPSGAGKTTVADVVAGLLHPTGGRLEVDGVPLDDGAWDAWRRGIGYVTQETVVFRDTVRANLAWVRPEATEDEMWEALRMAAADGFVARLPRGLDTELAERGGGLSGGERQRLALARALLRAPDLLILDEATSSLDAESEARVLEAVQRLRGRVTVLLATHRLSTLRIADRVYLLEGGRVAESGTWESLRLEGARFRRLLGEER